MNKLRDFTLLWAVSTVSLYGATVHALGKPYTVLSLPNAHSTVMVALFVALIGHSVVNTIRSSAGRWIFLVVYFGCSSFLFWLVTAASAVV